jgi:uncharacterized protein YgiM (DUF1202 family)
MASLDSLKTKLYDLLIEKDGDVKPWDLKDIFAQAKELNLEEKQVNKLLVEVDQSINWEAIRKQKEDSIKKVEDLKRIAQEQTEKEQNAEETLDFMIKQCAADKVINSNEIAVFFEVSASLNQNEIKSALLFKNYIEKNNFVPLTTPKGTSIKTLLLSTDWYKDQLPAPPPPPPKPFPWKQVIVAISLLIIAGGVVFYLLWLKPYLEDKNAKRYYTYVDNLILRSTQVAGVDYNFLQKLKYGTELLVYSENPETSEWASVKANGQKGFVSTQFILNKRDFYELTGIFGDTESKEAISSGKCRLALLKYFQDTISRNIMGKIDPQIQQEIYGGQKNKEVWQVFSKGKDIKPNTVAFPRFTDPNSKFTDFACIIKNIATNQRKLLIFTFSEIGIPSLVYEADAPEVGYIVSIKRSRKYDETQPIIAYSN